MNTEMLEGAVDRDDAIDIAVETIKALHDIAMQMTSTLQSIVDLVGALS